MTQEKIAINNLRSSHLFKEVYVEGIVKESKAVEPMITNAAYFCERCEHIFFVPQTNEAHVRPNACENEMCSNKKLRLVEEKSTWTDVQDIVIAEPEYKDDADDVAHKLTVRLKGDFTDTVKLNEKLVVNGILETKFTKQRKSNISEFLLNANSITHLPSSKTNLSIDKETLNINPIEPIQRKNIEVLKKIIRMVSDRHSGGKAPLEEVYIEAEAENIDRKHAEDAIKRMSRLGDLIKPDVSHVRLV